MSCIMTTRNMLGRQLGTVNSASDLWIEEYHWNERRGVKEVKVFSVVKTTTETKVRQRQH